MDDTSAPVEDQELAEPDRPHLPASTADLQRQSPRRYSIRQEVEDIWERLYNSDQEFRDLLDAAVPEESVTGSLRMDTALATALLVDRSGRDSQLRVPRNQGGPGLAKIASVLNEVLKVWNISRKQQREQRLLGA
jgi:hypothetical protein